MKDAWLGRTSTGDQGTFGHLYSGDKHWHTGERPWRNNEPFISCIPTGIYIVEWIPEGRWKGYVVTNVTDRDAIEIHIANFMGDRELGWKSEVEGCIALGTSIADPGWAPRDDEYGHYIKKQKAVKDSTNAIKSFNKYMNKESFRLYIEQKYIDY